MRRELVDQCGDRCGLIGSGRPISGQRDADFVAAFELVDALIRSGLRVGQKRVTRSDTVREVLPSPFEHTPGREGRKQRIAGGHEGCNFGARRPRWRLLLQIGQDRQARQVLQVLQVAAAIVMGSGGHDLATGE
jgi:hypothetical protein